MSSDGERLDVINQRIQVMTGSSVTAKKFCLCTEQELLARQRPRWIVKNLIPDTSTGLIYGASKAGKSFFALRLFYAVAHGWPEVFGLRIKAQRPVIYLCLEGAGDFRNRVEAIRSWAIENALPLDGKFLFCDAPFSLVSDVQEFLESCRDNVEHPIVVIDTLARASGGLEENSNTEMQRVADAMQRIAREMAGTCVAIHHAGKDSARGPRGASSVLAALDFAIECVRAENSRMWRVEKAKGSRDDLHGNFTLKIIDLGKDDDDDPITSCICIETEEPKVKVFPQLPQEEKRALTTLNRLSKDKPDSPQIQGVAWRDAYVEERMAIALDSGGRPNLKNLRTTWAKVARNLVTKGHVVVIKEEGVIADAISLVNVEVRLNG